MIRRSIDDLRLLVRVECGKSPRKSKPVRKGIMLNDRERVTAANDEYRYLLILSSIGYFGGKNQVWPIEHKSIQSYRMIIQSLWQFQRRLWSAPNSNTPVLIVSLWRKSSLKVPWIMASLLWLDGDKKSIEIQKY